MQQARHSHDSAGAGEDTRGVGIGTAASPWQCGRIIAHHSTGDTNAGTRTRGNGAVFDAGRIQFSGRFDF